MLACGPRLASASAPGGGLKPLRYSRGFGSRQLGFELFGLLVLLQGVDDVVEVAVEE